MTSSSNQLFESTISRRQFTLASAVAGAGLVLPFRIAPVVADGHDFSSLDLPTLDVTITADGFEGIPDTLEAGRYLINATVDGEVEGGALGFLSPHNMSAEEFLGFIMGGPPDGSPVAESEEGGEEGGEEEGPLPSWVYQSRFAGGVLATPDSPGMAVIDLQEGEWIAWGDDPSSQQQPVIVTVTGAFPADVEEPEADVTVTLLDFDILFDGDLVAGEHIIHVTNQGAQPHFLEFATVPDGTTREDLGALIGSFMGTPAATTLTEEDFGESFYTPTQSIGTSTWTAVSLAAGTYAAMCWFPTAGRSDPHAVHGMYTIVEIAE